MKKKVFILILLLATLSGLSPVFVSAASPFDEVCTDASGNPRFSEDDPDIPSVCLNRDNPTDPLTGQDGEGILIRAARLITIITGIASIIIIIVGSIKYMTSTGDPNSVNNAKNTILYAVVGLVVALLSQGIILFVTNRLK